MRVLPPKPDQIYQDRSNLMPPPPHYVKETLIQFKKIYIVLGMSIAISKHVHPIQPKNGMDSISLANNLTSLRVEYCDSTMDLGKVPINATLNWIGLKLNSSKYLALITHLGNLSSWFLYKPTHHVKWDALIVG